MAAYALLQRSAMHPFTLFSFESTQTYTTPCTLNRCRNFIAGIVNFNNTWVNFCEPACLPCLSACWLASLFER